MAPKVYLCQNKSCSLGNARQPGRFTGGISKEQAISLSGDPEAEHGNGICPNCGKPAKEE